MRLFKRGETYYVEFNRGDKQSLKTSDPVKAQAIHDRLYKQWIMGKLVRLEPGNNITLEKFIEEYLDSRDGLSAKTRSHDKLALNSLASVVGASTPLKLIDAKKLDEFTRICLNKGLQANHIPLRPASVNSYLRQIKSAFSFAVDRGYIPSAPKIKMVAAGKHLPRYLKPNEIAAILKKTDEIRPEFSTMLRFYLWTGARRNEALALTWRDCHLQSDRPSLILTGKGNRQRSIPMLPPLREILEPMQKEIGHVFPRWHESTITHWFKAICRACSPPIDARLHDLRHTAATYMMANGVPVRMVQEIMGHAQLSTTMIYAEIIRDHLYDQMAKLKFEL